MCRMRSKEGVEEGKGGEEDEDAEYQSFKGNKGNRESHKDIF